MPLREDIRAEARTPKNETNRLGDAAKEVLYPGL
jgi:hypothetical protein